MNDTEPYVSLGVLIDDDTTLRPAAHIHDDGPIAYVQIGIGNVRVQSDSPAALRRLAAALTVAADQADRLTAASAA